MAAVGAEDALLISGTEEAPPCELLSVIGETPRATTFLAEQTWPLRRLVAFKLFKDDAFLALDPKLGREATAPTPEHRARH